MRRAGRALAVLLATSGLGALAYMPPWRAWVRAGTNPVHVAWHLSIHAAVMILHAAAACGLCALAILACVRRARDVDNHNSGARAGRLCVAIALVASCALAAAVPWDALLPWSWSRGPNLARPTLLSDAGGPFPELVGVAARYGPRRYPLAGLMVVRGRTLSVFAVAHGLVAPVAYLVATRRRRRWAPGSSSGS